MPATISRSSPEKGTQDIPQNRATPGPYSVAVNGDDLLVVAPDPAMAGCIGLLAQVYRCDFPKQAEANAGLLAASGDLLAALKVMRERHQIDEPHHADLCEFCKMADAAIAKAEGR